MKVVITEKNAEGQLKPIDARDWNDQMIAMLHHSNYLLVGGKEYEMVEGRLNVNETYMELLVLPVSENKEDDGEEESV